jgi:hypothetical protein
MKDRSRLNKASKLRRKAKRRLPELLTNHHRAWTAAAVAAKAPREPRQVQRAKKLEALEAKRVAMAKRREELKAQLVRPIFEEVPAPKPHEAAGSPSPGEDLGR